MKNTIAVSTSIVPKLCVYVACIGLVWGLSGSRTANGHPQHEEKASTESLQVMSAVAGNAAPELPDVRLTTHDGQSVRFQDLLENRLSIINFIYTSCTNVCPLTTANFLQLKQLAGDRDFQMISVSIDPQRDTPSRLRAFMKTQGAMSPHWTFLTGSSRSITPLLGGFGFYNVAVDAHSPGVVIWDGRTRQWTRLVSLPPPHILFEELQKFFPGEL